MRLSSNTREFVFILSVSRLVRRRISCHQTAHGQWLGRLRRYPWRLAEHRAERWLRIGCRRGHMAECRAGWASHSISTYPRPENNHLPQYVGTLQSRGSAGGGGDVIAFHRGILCGRAEWIEAGRGRDGHGGGGCVTDNTVGILGIISFLAPR